MDAAVKYEGESVVIGGVTYVAPPVAFGTLRRGMFDRIRKMDREDFDLQLAADVVLASLQRNYPSLTMETFDECPASITREITAAFNVIVRLSGFTSAPAESEGNAAPGTSP